MKNSIGTTLAALMIHCCVSAQHIPDDNFANVIRANCSDCIDANNDLLPAAKYLKKLEAKDVNYINSVEGVEGFSTLEELDVSYNHGITELPNLPASLKELWIRYTNVNNIRTLPPKLEILNCESCPLTSLPGLPATLQRIWADKSELTSLPSLPASLWNLECNNTPITSLPSLPKGLQYLYIYGTKITTLPPLPDGLKAIKISDNTFDCIPSNNPDLWIRDIYGDSVKTTLCKGYSNSTEAKAEKNETKEKCISGNCTNGIGTYVVDGPDGHFTYKGSFKDGIQDGKGILTSSDGSVYNGQWKNGKFDGNGTMLFKNGKKSTGIWKEGVLWSGTGFFMYEDNSSYYGGVKENTPDGQGVCIFSNGKRFTGTLSKGSPVTGKGYFFYSGSKVSYEGTIVNGKYSGQGTYTDANGQIFTGNFVNGDLTGYGKLIAPAGGHYEGNFKNGMFDGYGQMTYDKGYVYKGNWTNGKRNGSGSSYDANGNLDYSGEWNDGEIADPKKSVSYKTKLWEKSKEMFSRVTFKGWGKQTVNGEKGTVDITDEYYLNPDYSLYGTTETIITFGDTKYRVKSNFTGTFDPVTFKIHVVNGSLIYQDELPGGLFWKEGGGYDGTLYTDASHAGYHVIKGQSNSSGEDLEISDY